MYKVMSRGQVVKAYQRPQIKFDSQQLRRGSVLKKDENEKRNGSYDRVTGHRIVNWMLRNY